MKFFKYLTIGLLAFSNLFINVHGQDSLDLNSASADDIRERIEEDEILFNEVCLDREVAPEWCNGHKEFMNELYAKLKELEGGGKKKKSKKRRRKSKRRKNSKRKSKTRRRSTKRK